MTKPSIDLINREDVAAITGATHQDVFSLLGIHSTSTGKGLLVRAFLPGAQAVEAIDCKSGKLVAALDCVDPAGLFVGKMGRRRVTFAYRLRVTYASAVVEIDDPYRFASTLSEQDLYLFCEGTHERVYQWMGAHQISIQGVSGTRFVVWAPSAQRVSVVGDFNLWDGRCHVMRKHPGAGVWELFIPNLPDNARYKYEILSHDGVIQPLKADPYAFAMQHPPETASKIKHQQPYDWQDQAWMTARDSHNAHHRQAVSIYEVHLGSWRRNSSNSNGLRQGYLSYAELAEQLIAHVQQMGFSHIQLMPISEYPFDGSWGYQPVGLFAPTSRFGSATDFKAFVDAFHQAGIGVLLDWVPGHFPTDPHGTGKFDGSCLYEHEDERRGFHPDWNTLIYNYGRAEVQSYLISNALYWLDEFHIDGLRVDAVASMLYLDYSREEGQWLPNVHGGRENLEAIALLQQVNTRAYRNYPGIMMIAEESTAWPGVTQPVDNGGLGFGFKWNMGWMNDSLSYMQREPVYRKYHHNDITFSLVYSFSENFILPLSHDEVVHGKGSLLNKMPGDAWQKFANLRAYYAFMWTHPGKKLLFMGGEFAQGSEWNHDHSLDWHLLEYDNHRQITNLLQDLNRVYRQTPALYQLDCEAAGFEWLDGGNHEQSILVYLRKGESGTAPVLVVVNFTPVVHHEFNVGVPEAGYYQELVNTDSKDYGGSDVGNAGGVHSSAQACNGQPHQLTLNIPPLATLIFRLNAQ